MAERSRLSKYIALLGCGQELDKGLT
jgi:hypothetical protein